jgi:hypothetical protein
MDSGDIEYLQLWPIYWCEFLAYFPRKWSSVRVLQCQKMAMGHRSLPRFSYIMRDRWGALGWKNWFLAWAFSVWWPFFRQRTSALTSTQVEQSKRDWGKPRTTETNRSDFLWPRKGTRFKWTRNRRWFRRLLQARTRKPKIESQGNRLVWESCTWPLSSFRLSQRSSYAEQRSWSSQRPCK